MELQMIENKYTMTKCALVLYKLFDLIL
jgi:hypothetical protein